MAATQLRQVLRHLRDTESLSEASDAELLGRFTAGREEAAFAALVRRHGPMVLGVARRALPSAEDAEDVFQATFLVLARKAASVRKRESVGSWLHGVAHRLALRLRDQDTRRRQRERRAADMRNSGTGSDAAWRDVREALDAALGELPEKYRAALVLCYLEGKTHQEAARLLGCPLVTLRTHIARGRTLLRKRLTARGLALSATGVAALLIASTAPAGTPAALVKAAAGVAVPFAAGQSAAALCSPRVAGLVRGGLRALFLDRARTALVMLLAVGLVTSSVAVTQRLTAADEGANPPAATSARPPAVPASPPIDKDRDSVTYAGRVLGQAGRPVPGAKLYLSSAVGYLKRPSPSPVRATTGPDGRFAFTAPQAKRGGQATIVTAAADAYGPGWVEVPADGKRDGLTLRLVEDDVPITGQIVDLEAKPVAGATLTVLQINAAPDENPEPWLKAVKGKAGLRLEFEFEKRYLPRFTTALSPKVTTDAAGRFRLTGMGRNRLVRVQLDGPTIASQQLYILTRPGQTLAVPLIDADPSSGTPGLTIPCYPASFRHVAGPTRPVVGVLRDKDTGKPLPGVTVQSYRIANNLLARPGLVRGTSDAQGRYRLVGLPKGKGNQIVVLPAADQPYLEAAAEVPDPPGVGPVTLDFRLKRGIWIEGRLTDKATGRPVQAEVDYLPQIGNRFVRDYPGYAPLQHLPAPNVHKDGTFRVVGLPGPGLLAVGPADDPYLTVQERDDEEGTLDTVTNTTPLRVSTEGFVALARVEVPPGAETCRRDVALDPGQSLTGTVLGPDGKPLAGARSYRLAGLGWERSPLKTASFTVRAFNPRRPRLVLFLHPEKRLVGVLGLSGEKTDAIRVRMRAGATVVGRLVDADGLPRANVELLLGIHDRSQDMWVSYFPDRIRTDRDGRFRIEALLPGQRYMLFDGRGGEAYFGDVWILGGSLHAGKALDLGDVQLKRGGG